MTVDEKTMLEYARAQKGKPYKLGASGPTRFDCSGLILRAAQQIGLTLYHGASTQRNRGLKSGDPTRYGYWKDGGTIDTLPADQFAILYHADAEKPNVMAHTGMYEGDGNVIQAGGYGGKGVHEGPIDKRRWTYWYTLRGDRQAANTTVTVTVRKGSRGDTVEKLQAALTAVGYPLETDGCFGPVTEAALIEYQKANGLSPDGICGPLTWAKIGVKS